MHRGALLFLVASFVLPRAARAAPDAAPRAPSPDAAPRAPSPDAAPRAAPPPRGIDDAIVVLSADGGAFARRLDYVDKITPTLRSYDLGAAPFGVVSAEVYPFARAGWPVDVGVTGSVGRSIGAESAAASGERLSSTYGQLDVGGRARVRLGGTASPVVGVHGGYGAMSFSFADAGALGGELPDVSYTFARFGLDVRVPIGRFAAQAAADYLDVLSAGAVADRFPRASLDGLVLQLGAAFTVLRGLEAHAGVHYTRFIYALSPVLGDRYVAGGATDDLAYATVGLSYFQ